MSSDHYLTRQAAHDEEYREAWKSAPESFKQRASEMGLEPETFSGSQAMHYEEGYATASYTPDIAEEIDTVIDRLVEKHGAAHEVLIRSVAIDLQKPMEVEIEKNRALMLGRVACYLVKGETSNVLARIHGLLHSIPRLATICGFPSMRASARACDVSVEWIRNWRNNWCSTLEIPVPAEGQKSAEAKEKYRDAANTRHWRDRKFQNQPEPTPCNPTLPQPNLPQTNRLELGPA